MRRSLRRAPAGGVRVHGGARAAQDRRRVPALHAAPARDGLSALPGADAVDGGGAAAAEPGARARWPRASWCRAARCCAACWAGGEQTACEYRTAHDVTLWPLELADAEYTSYVADLGDVRPPGAQRAGALRLHLRTTAGLKLRPSSRSTTCRCSSAAATSSPTRLYEQLVGTRRPWSCAARHAASGWQHVIAASGASAVGLRRRRGAAAVRPALVPGLSPAAGVLRVPAALSVRRAAAGWRARCGAATPPSSRSSCCSSATTAPLEGVVERRALALFCTPAINLFPRRADRIHSQR